MPRGRYSFHDPHDHTPLGDEHFHCATGPSGWRYTARTTATDGSGTGSVDLTTDELGRPIRLELHAGGWQVRGAALDGVTWVRTAPATGTPGADPADDRGEEHNAPVPAFTGTSPAFLVATARLLRLAPTAPATRIRLIALTSPVLAPRTVDQSWSLVARTPHATDNGPLIVDEYQVRALDTGEQYAVHLAGDVVLSAPGVELEDLESPPSEFTM
ncbi:hypothetical protein [Streptantibioticus silvisoli]|uniref:Glycolipid-binding domain-containing protein n=1 Tax=Streptantibioticus silvisoli TaxID=2705255 RepID=A0ABT6W4K0_9ACTN|nr:hypothetical protein [Streptantibioticus silvisoli]MDI5965194.1 hypothetical protein [Streptantibioticus silvisoli]